MLLNTIFFHIQTIKQRQRHRIKYIYDTKNINIYFHYWGGFLSGGLCPEGFCLVSFCPRPGYYCYYVEYADVDNPVFNI
jgi:hypothetical protein